ncbi:TPA: hypothetical protein ACNVXO_005678 [Pseudomonas aeruginosa]|uniref:hypothetical protein n=2 Tax=Pseudomonas aeruginosa TaxID=287 RepID=UPI000E738B8F|nr:hypothetical protein [Pseudomonas aeruginosa]MBY5292164.1 hypothetical protein [Pseudomonas aeruginosa]MCV6243896.1 hypothetical protein [Pseudomonas aeruginosa]MCV6532140.1 hypothetical protein [Pseudomonas aeruginosa]MDY1134690.1 hypothetical protein [Pseudomonas aeruginosa]MEA8566765.1 hypothetical protein [Pseudomonas aeruginosa]
MTHALFKQIDLTAKLGQDGSSLQAMNALRVIRETVAKHLPGAEAAEEHPLERAVLALRTIAEFPCPEQDNMPAANMRQIALAALSGAGASSEPGNPGGEPVSGPGNAGERPLPAPGLAREHAELRRIAVALKNPLLSGEEASNLMVRYEALTMPDHIIALIDGQAQATVPKGWKLVPHEPTPEMLDARRDSEDGMDGYLVEDTEYYFPDRGAVRDFLACVYRGLLAAAPAPGGER